MTEYVGAVMWYAFYEFSVYDKEGLSFKNKQEEATVDRYGVPQTFTGHNRK